MNGAELAPGLVFAAVGLALSFASSGRVLASGLAALLSAALVAASIPVGEDFLGTALTGCWVSVLIAAACVHLPGRLGLLPAVGISLNGGAWAGLVAAASEQPVDLLQALPEALSWALLSLPGAALVARRRGVAVKVVLSWLAAAAVLSLGLNMAPTLGYEPDHMG